MKSMVRYIRYSDKEHVVDEATAELDTIVREARANEEVSMVYLRALEREEELKEEGRNIRDQEKIEEMLQRGKQPKEIADFCGYPMELILKVEKGIS
ncbi:MAG: hypothetical protein II745_02005, partial [Lachnospiraceae bacterium]|nr:hypothetical protein [Lachnospiraceae bacterium]